MKAKKALLSLLIASPLMLTACPDSGGSRNTGNNGGGTAVPAPGSDSSVPSEKSIAFFNGLRNAENLLQQKYWFTSSISGGNITYTDLGKVYLNGQTSFEMLAQRQGRSVRSVKVSFYDDIYAFARNLSLLKIREVELRAHNESLYNEYYAKTFALGKIFIVKRAKIYSRVLELREERLRRMGIQDVNIIARGVLDINVLAVNSSKIRKKSRRSIINAITRSKQTCDGLDTMLNDPNFKDHLKDLALNTCSSSPAVEAVSKLGDIDSLSKREIISVINKSSVVRLTSLNTVADSYLAANSIALNFKKASGINNRLRKNWEAGIIQQYPGVRRRKLEKAMDNNLYDNLIFKKAIIEALRELDPNMGPRQNSKTTNELIAISRALTNLKYQRVNIVVGSSAVENGVDLNSNPVVVDDLVGDKAPEPDVIIDDLDDLDDLDTPPAPPVKKPAPKKGGEAQPPTPPKTIRRP